MAKRKAALRNDRNTWTENWWASQLLLHDWLPNEQKVRFRGQGFGFLHKNVYKVEMALAGLLPLSYNPWRFDGSKAGLMQLHQQNKLPGSDISKLHLKRSANHSNTPECVTCQENRKRHDKLRTTVRLHAGLNTGRFSEEARLRFMHVRSLHCAEGRRSSPCEGSLRRHPRAHERMV